MTKKATKIINKKTQEVQTPKKGDWCNVGDSKYEIMNIQKSGVILVESLFLGEIRERKIILKTLIKQIDKKGFYKPSDSDKKRKAEIKKELIAIQEMREEPKKELNASQKRFCKFYLDPKEYGNGVSAYMKAYPKCDYDSAKHGASRLLRDTHICTHLALMLDTAGFNQANIDKQTLHVINQMDDLPSKMRGIAEANKIWGRITQNINHTGSVGNSDLKNMTTAELVKRKEEMEKEANEEKE